MQRQEGTLRNRTRMNPLSLSLSFRAVETRSKIQSLASKRGPSDDGMTSNSTAVVGLAHRPGWKQPGKDLT